MGKRRALRSGLLGVCIAVAAIAAIIVAGGRITTLAAAPGAGATLAAGWTNVAYGSPTLPVEDALNDATAAVASVWQFDSSIQNWLTWRAAPAPLLS